MIVATAGHIDHGKTTLVKALTGVDTDRLPEEKLRGISIDLGFAYWTTPAGATIGFVDVPGHERFVRNMLAGVCAIDHVLLVVAADDGVMPQTREHLAIVNLLGIASGTVVLTKGDRVQAARVAEVARDISALLAPTSLAGAAIRSVSAVSGEGVAQLRSELAAAAEALRRGVRPGRRPRHVLDRAFTVPGSGTVVTGTLVDGRVAEGDRLRLSPSGLEVRVRAIQVSSRAVHEAAAGERCALNLAGVEVGQVRRGQWLVHPDLHAPSQRLDVRLRVLDTEAHALRHWKPVHLHLGTGDVLARVALPHGASIEPGGSALAQLVLEQPVAALHGDRFIVRDQSARRTLGGGMVLDPWPPARRPPAAQRAAQLVALELPDPVQALARLAECSPAGVDLTAFGRACNLDDAALPDLLQHAGLVAIRADGEVAVALSAAAVDELRAGIAAAVARWHQEQPRAAGIEVAALRAQCGGGLQASVFQALLRDMAAAKRIELAGGRVRRPDHVSTHNPADQRIWQLARPVLEEAGVHGITVAQLATDTRLKEALLHDFLRRLAATGEVVRVTPDRYYLRGTMAIFAAIAHTLAGETATGRFSAAEYRDRSGLGRALAIEVLETLDRLGVTRRIGDGRLMRQDFVAVLGPAVAPARPAATAVAARAPDGRS